MNEILTIILIILALTLNLIPFFITFQALFPARLLKTAEIASRMPGRSFVVGMVNFLFFTVMSVALFYLTERLSGIFQGLLVLPTLTLLVLLAIALSLGLAAISALVGERLFPAQPTWRRVLWGTLLLGMGASAPLVGWFLLLPYAAWVGMGAFIISFFQKTSNA